MRGLGAERERAREPPLAVGRRGAGGGEGEEAGVMATDTSARASARASALAALLPPGVPPPASTQCLGVSA